MCVCLSVCLSVCLCICVCVKGDVSAGGMCPVGCTLSPRPRGRHPSVDSMKTITFLQLRLWTVIMNHIVESLIGFETRPYFKTSRSSTDDEFLITSKSEVRVSMAIATLKSTTLCVKDPIVYNQVKWFITFFRQSKASNVILQTYKPVTSPQLLQCLQVALATIATRTARSLTVSRSI